MIPFLDRLSAAERVLVAGCGGGFDVFAGVPLLTQLLNGGKQVVLAGCSFSDRAADLILRIDRPSTGVPDLPERWVWEWLQRRDVAVPSYVLGKAGVRPLARAFRQLVDEHRIDLVVLVDGGTDSLIFGDEPGLGTVAEDAVSIVAAHEAAGENALLAAIGFGIDHFHGISHHSFLENVARLMLDGGFLGTFSVTAGTAEADALLDLVEYANVRHPEHRSIVANSIAGAVRGEFGDYQATDRTAGSELFINPMMAQYWTFRVEEVVRRMHFADALRQASTLDDARLAIERVRETLTVRPRRPIPL